MRYTHLQISMHGPNKDAKAVKFYRNLSKLLRNDHSYSRDWLWNLASFKGHNKGAAIYVESATTVHNLLFYVRTL